MDRLRSMAWVGVRRAVLRALPGALAFAALPALVEWDAAEAGGKHKKHHKKCCKKNRKQCDGDCNELPDGDRDICKQDCKIAQKQCKKVC